MPGSFIDKEQILDWISYFQFSKAFPPKLKISTNSPIEHGIFDNIVKYSINYNHTQPVDLLPPPLKCFMIVNLLFEKSSTLH